MQLLLNKRRLTLTILAIFVGDLVLFFWSGPWALARAQANTPMIALIVAPLLIVCAIAVQFWARKNPRYRAVGAVAYALTLVWSMAFVFVLFISVTKLVAHQ